MHVISRKALRVFWQRHPDSEQPLRRWHRILSTTDFATFGELRETFPSADVVDDLIVFNVGGNKYRIIASIHFNRRKVYVRHVLTHVDYDQGNWKK
jgi:mRNA interferase HigB